MKVFYSLLLLTSSFIFSQNSYYPYLDSNLEVNERVDDLMSRMTLFEKACQMNQGLDKSEAKSSLSLLLEDRGVLMYMLNRRIMQNFIIREINY